MDSEATYAQERQRLVETVRAKGIRDERVLEALARVPRHRFLPSAGAGVAYADDAQAIGSGQTISQPFTVAYQTQWLDLQPGERVLEIGTGSGYQSAVLVELGAEVCSVERHPPLQAGALVTLAELGYQLHLKLGDGAEGWPEWAPFDAILVTAAAPEVPRELLEQLRVPDGGRRGGRLVIPIGAADQQVMTRFVRRGPDDFVREEGDVFRFVPLVRGVAT